MKKVLTILCVCVGRTLYFVKSVFQPLKIVFLLSFEMFQPLFRTFTLCIVNCGSQNICISSVHRKRTKE